jgi:uncharacterized protein YeaO (DUF488 family)
MPLRLRSVQLGSPRSRGEGLRIGAVRYLPRGVAKSDYGRRDYFDVWLPTLAPSRELLRAYKTSGMTPATFYRRYRTEMRQLEARQTIELLARVAARTPLAVGCYCEDERRCHRRVLVELIRRASRRQAAAGGTL